MVQTRSSAAGVQSAAEGSAPLSVDAAMKTFHLPAGYRVELVASEPMIQDPVVIDWDADGRLWVVEMPGYMTDIQASHELDPLGRVVVLEDVDDDGKMDKRTVFAEGSVLARALKVLDRGILVGEPPNLWFMRDTNGDLKADTKELVSDQFGRLQANVEHNANGLMWALDNWIYTSEVDVYLRLKNGKFEVRKTLARGQWGLSQDDAGRVFRNTNESALYVDLVPTPYFFRNPNLRRTRGSYEFLGADSSLNTVWPIHPTRGVNRGYQAGVLRAGWHGSHPLPPLPRRPCSAATACRRICTGTSSLSNRARISSAGSSSPTMGRRCEAERRTRTPSSWRRRTSVSGPFTSRRHLTARSTWSTCIAASSSTVATSPSICGIRSSRESSNSRSGLRTHLPRRARDHAAGRRPSLSSASAARLVETLSHPNGWWRDTAQRLLVERGDKSDRRGAARSWRPVRRSREPGCTRCGPWMAWTRSNPQW